MPDMPEVIEYLELEDADSTPGTDAFTTVDDPSVCGV
jgi:hypothetical protein